MFTVDVKQQYNNNNKYSLTCDLEVLGSIPGPATYFSFSFRLFKKGSCQLLAKVFAQFQSTG